MFTGIVESRGQLQAIQAEGENQRLTIQAPFANELAIDQSVAHNGTCLTVEALLPNENSYEVVAIAETLARTNLGSLQAGDAVNLERSLRSNQRLDGHFVQGHVDALGEVLAITDHDGSWAFSIGYPAEYAPLLVEKGSIAVDGVSLTVAAVDDSQFTVAIIPYTYENTSFRAYQAGSRVNLEFDVLGKYVRRMIQNGQPAH